VINRFPAKKILGRGPRVHRANAGGELTVPKWRMRIHKGFARYMAIIWPDAEGVPTAEIREWDRDANRLGPFVATVHFSDNHGDTFQEVITRLHYEVDDQQTPFVSAQGVAITLRRKKVPVTVPAPAPATVGA
jgi:hypothetical protein